MNQNGTHAGEHGSQQRKRSSGDAASVPANVDAERAVIGSILIDPDVVLKLDGVLRPEDFYLEKHRHIFNAMLSLTKQGMPIDFVTLMNELERRDWVDEAGGPVYITDLIAQTPTSVHAEHYAQIVKRMSGLRQLMYAGGEIAKLAWSQEGDVADLIDQAERTIFRIAENGTAVEGMIDVRDAVNETITEIDRAQQDQGKMGLPTGFSMIDHILGGLYRSDLILVAGRPGMGKSAFATCIVDNATAKVNARVAIFNLEMSNVQFVQRLLSMLTGIDSHRLRVGDVDESEWVVLVEAANDLAARRVFLDDTPGLSVAALRGKARRIAAEHGLDLIVIDYMQLLASGSNVPVENRQQEVSYICRSLKNLARELNVPVVALSQLSRAVEQRADKRPMLSDLRESGCLTGDTLVTMADTGERRAIRDLVGQHGFRVWALNEQTMKLEKATVSAAFSTGVKPVYRLVTRLGRTIRATANHPFLTIDGWRRLDQLESGVHLALPRVIPTQESASMSNAELALLAHLIGDGCTLPTHVVQYTTREMELANIVSRFASDVFGDAVAPRISHEHKWYQVYLASTRRHTHGVRGAIPEWLSSMGVWGLRSGEKYVPERVFQQPQSGIAVFLRHLWATDGSVGIKRTSHGYAPNIHYATKSRRLAYDVQSLLLRCGINARVRRVTKQEYRWYSVILSGKADVSRFCEVIGTVGQRHAERMLPVRSYIAEKSENTNRDVIPASVWRRSVVPAMEKAGLTTRQMQSSLGSQYCGTSLYRSNLSRERAAKVGALVKSDSPLALADSDVYWDQVVSVEVDGVEEVYDLTVPVLHNFVANDIVVHNSLEQDSDVILFLYRDDYYNEDSDRVNIADVDIAKHRHGQTGTVSLYFRKELTQFRDLELERVELTY